MPAIASVRAKEILDSQGHPTIEVALSLDDGQTVTTSVPNGIRRYPQEAFVLTDQDPNHMEGRGVGKAVALINQTIGPQLVGQDPTQQATLDQWLLSLDATPQKSQAGANTFATVSQAILKAGAAASGLSVYQYLITQYQLTDRAEIPTGLYGLVNGGQYGAGNLDIQEFLIIPASHVDYRVSLEIESALRNELQRLLQKNKANYATGALGGFTPTLQKNSDVFEYIIEAARNTPYLLARDFFFGIDTGADTLAQQGKYVLKDKGTAFSERELIEFYSDWREKYNLTYFEDPFAAKDTNAWRTLTSDLGETTRIAGDIVTATNPSLVKQAAENTLCNTLVVKPSQIGTVTEALEAIKTAREAGWAIVVSQRTGETNDDLLADFAVGVGAEFVKFGPTNRGEAVSKYNRLADIYRELEQSIAQGATMTDQNTTAQPAVQSAAVPQPADPNTLPQPSAPLATPISTEPPMNIPASPTPAVDASANPPAPSEPAAASATPPAPTPAPAPSAPPTALEQPVEVQPPAPAGSADLPLPATPPSAPAASPAPPAVENGLETDLQQVINNSVAEIGTAPTPPADQAAPVPPAVEPPAPAAPATPPDAS